MPPYIRRGTTVTMPDTRTTAKTPAVVARVEPEIPREVRTIFVQCTECGRDIRIPLSRLGPAHTAFDCEWCTEGIALVRIGDGSIEAVKRSQGATIP